MIGDLHCHTRLSDGSISIDDLVFYSKRAGLDFISITDHDTMEGVTRAAVLGKRYGINVIAGCEISCMDFERGRKAHILCYLPDKPDRLQGMLNQTLESRTKAGQRMMLAVMRYYPVTEEHIKRYTMGSKSIYKAHLIQALLDLGYDCQTHGELYYHLFGSKTGICARESEYPDVHAALELVRSAGGVSVLAHPGHYDSWELLTDIAQKGQIDGVEVYSPKADSGEQDKLAALAREYGLLITGGSDFHGFMTGRPCPLASRITNEQDIHALFSYKRKLARA